MTFRILFPKTLPPEGLDRLLARGWFRMRRSMFTTRYLLDDKGLHTAIWARLTLDGFQFRPGLVRLMRKLERRFTITVAPAAPGPEERQLYQDYVAHVGGDRPEFLRDVLGEEPGLESPFDTWQVSVRDPRDNDRLVAFSLFDLGRTSLQSVLGVYDPSLSQHSLGFATMLWEIRFGLERSLAFHYPGYVVEDVPAFDYKRRVGDLDYLDPLSRRWRPIAEMDPEDLPDRRMRRGLDAVLALLQEAGLPAGLRCYPPFQLVHVHGAQRRCLAEPLFLVLGELKAGEASLGVTSDPDTGTFAIDAWVPTRDLSNMLNPARAPLMGPPAEWHVLTRAARLAVVDDAPAAAEQVLRHWQSRQVVAKVAEA